MISRRAIAAVLAAVVAAATAAVAASTARAKPLLERVSVGLQGGYADADTYRPAISPGGRYVAFIAIAPSGRKALFVRDRKRRATVRIERVATDELFGFDGRHIGYVRFSKDETRTDDRLDYVLRDLRTGRVTALNRDAQGQPVRVGSNSLPSASRAARYFAFESFKLPVVPGDEFTDDVFVRDRVRSATIRVSEGLNGAQGDGQSIAPAVSADGRYVAFLSNSTNLVTGDTNAAVDVFVRDLKTDTTTRVSVSGDGDQQNSKGTGFRSAPAISADGRYIAFDSDATNLVAHDTNRHLDVFVYDRQTHTTRRVSVGPGGVQANNDSARVWFLGPRLLMYGSNATNLVPGDHHRAYALFVRNLRSGKTVRAAPAPIDPETLDWGQPLTYASRGRYIAFTNGLPGAGRRPPVGVFVYGPLRHRFALPR